MDGMIDQQTMNNLLADGSNQGLILDSEWLQGFNLKVGLKESPPYSVLNEKVISDYVGFAMKANNFVFAPMNRKVAQFIESGLARIIVDKYLCNKRFADVSGPKVLSLEHLNAGFMVWIALVIVSICAFICEVCWKHISKLKSKFIELRLGSGKINSSSR